MANGSATVVGKRLARPTAVVKAPVSPTTVGNRFDCLSVPGEEGLIQKELEVFCEDCNVDHNYFGGDAVERKDEIIRSYEVYANEAGERSYEEEEKDLFGEDDMEAEDEDEALEKGRKRRAEKGGSDAE